MRRLAMPLMLMLLVVVMLAAPSCKKDTEPADRSILPTPAEPAQGAPAVEQPAVQETPAPAPAPAPAPTPAIEMPAPAPAAAEPGLPVLFSFETADSAAAWQVEDDLKNVAAVSVVEENATQGKRALKLVLKQHEWPGMFTTKLPKNWTLYETLKFDVTADQDADINVRIDDENSTDYGSRFNSPGQPVAKGKNTVTIDLLDVGDAIDLKKVKAMYIFVAPVEKDLTLYIDNIRFTEPKK